MHCCSKIYQFIRMFVIFISLCSLSLTCIILYLQSQQFEELLVIAVKTTDPSHIKYIGKLKSPSDPLNSNILDDFFNHFRGLDQ